MEIFNLFRILIYVDSIQSYLHLKMGLPPVLKAVSSGTLKKYTRKLKERVRETTEGMFCSCLLKEKNQYKIS
jgi:hypothetical protein